MTTIYIVRHAESDANSQRKLQHDDSSLSEKGAQQAEILAERFHTIPLDLIITSPFRRAVKTAEQFSLVSSAHIVTSQLLVNRKKASEAIGMSYHDPELAVMNETMRSMRHDPTWHYSDEENFYDLKRRVMQFLEEISHRTEEHIVVVTHAAIVRLLVMCMIYGESLHADQFYSFYEHTKVDNVGLTVCEKRENEWRLMTWNDISHLGE